MTKDEALRDAVVEVMRHQFTQSREAMHALQVLIDAADEAADEIERLRAFVSTQQSAAAWCEQHKPEGHVRSQCLVCSGEKLICALSQISYLCGEPNEMGVSLFDVFPDERAVVDAVRAKIDEIERLRAALAAERERAPLTWEQVWQSERIMAANSEAGLLMRPLLQLVRAVEAEHGIVVGSALLAPSSAR